MLNQMNIKYEMQEKKNKMEEIYDAFDESPYRKYIETELEKIVEQPIDLPVTEKNSSSQAEQMGILMSRMFVNIFREPRLFRVRLIMGIFTSLLAGLIWLRLPESFTGGTDRIAATYFLVSSVMFSTTSGPITLFAIERSIFYREHNGGMYSAGAFYLSKLITDLPMNIVAPVVSSAIGFWLMGLHDDFVNFCYFTVFLIGLTFVAHALGMMLASMFDDPTVGIRIQMLIMLPLMLFSGFFLNNLSVPVYFIWLQYISPIRYAFSGAIVAVLHQLPLNCTSSELVQVSIPIELNHTMPNSFGNYTESFPTMNSTDFFLPNGTGFPSEIFVNISLCPVTSGDTLLSQLDIDTTLQWLNILVLFGMFVIFHVIAFIFIRFCKRTK